MRSCAAEPLAAETPAPERSAGPALDLHEGIADPRLGGCLRWPEGWSLVNHSTGELRRGRCRATNLCPYCARLFAVETSELLLLDAIEDAPALYAVLTAREHLVKATVREHLQQLRRSTRRRWPAIRWAVLVEFQRRGALHLNLLVKGVPVEDADELRDHLAARWCARVDARPNAQFVGPVTEGAGLVRYISLHFLKPEQAAPIGWRGHRVSYTRDYLVRPASVMRAEARRSLRIKRLLWQGLDVETAELELAARECESWSLTYVRPGSPAADGRAPRRGARPRPAATEAVR